MKKAEKKPEPKVVKAPKPEKVKEAVVEAPKVEKPKVEKPKAEVAVAWSPSVGEKCLFVNAENEFVASINSFEPLSVTMHSIRGGCQVVDELSIDSLSEYTISELTRAEVVARMSDAGI